MSRSSPLLAWAWIVGLVVGWMPAGAASADPPGKPKEPLTDERLCEALSRPITVQFKKTPLADAVGRLQELLGVPVHVDQKSVGDVWGSKDATISEEFSGVSAWSVLDLVLHGLDLDWCLYRGETLLIASRERAEQELVTRTYDVRDLVVVKDETSRNRDEFDGIIEVIETTVQPRTWQETAGGLGTIKGYTAPGVVSLVVANTWRAHQEIKALLTDIRGLRRVDGGERGQGAGYRGQGAGYRGEGTGDRLQGTGDRGQITGDSGYRLSVVGYRPTPYWKSEYRIPRSETNAKSEIQMFQSTSDARRPFGSLDAWCFEFI